MSLNSRFFTRDEFSCSCGCGFDVVDSELLDVLESVRHEFEAPVIITGGNRCEKHNADIGGSAKSQHIFGKAVDFKVKGVHADVVASYLEKEFTECGIGRYNGRTHVDVRGNKARWDKRVKK